ncbi:hypothetical protein A4S06_01945 [Erysipelotrichaceae bacterium MTC7]|nr:hypothetical protein A4S06_01945 [Erysipelotrichaceae bacterium MTC7]
MSLKQIIEDHQYAYSDEMYTTAYDLLHGEHKKSDQPYIVYAYGLHFERLQDKKQAGFCFLALRNAAYFYDDEKLTDQAVAHSPFVEKNKKSLFKKLLMVNVVMAIVLLLVMYFVLKLSILYTLGLIAIMMLINLGMQGRKTLREYPQNMQHVLENEVRDERLLEVVADLRSYDE